MHVLHPGREMRHDINTTFALLSGRDKRGEKIEGFSAQPEWKEIIRLTTTSKRQEGIKGSPKIVSRNMCVCMSHAKTSQCSCPYCCHYVENADVRQRR